MKIKQFAVPINFIVFQACWFGSVLGTANNLGWLGPLLVFFTVPLQIYILTENHKVEFLFVMICGILGFFLETIMIVGNVYIPFDNSWGMFCPPWMAGLWFNFAMLVSISLAWLKGKYVLAVLIGGVFGPLAYWGGEKLGAIELATDNLRWFIPMVLCWALVLPFLVSLHNKLINIEKK
jgi:hypothetical protein